MPGERGSSQAPVAYGAILEGVDVSLVRSWFGDDWWSNG